MTFQVNDDFLEDIIVAAIDRSGGLVSGSGGSLAMRVTASSENPVSVTFPASAPLFTISSGSQTVTGSGNYVRIGDGANLDAFSRLRVSQNNILFSNEFLYSKRPLVWDEKIVGTATASLNVDRASVILSASTTGDTACRQTREYFRYLSGQGQQILLTFTDMNPVVDLHKRVGYFDDNNGLFIESSGSTVSFVRRSNVTGTPVNFKIPQDQWNLDKFDGTGPSGITLDFAKAQILVIDYQWLGTGRVRFGFDVDGILYYAHQILHANNIDSVYMSSPTLPVRYEISSSGGSGGLEQICSAVNREGGEQDRGIITTAYTALSQSTATTTYRSLVSVRLRQDHIRGTITPVNAFVNALQNADFEFTLLLNPTFPATTGSMVWNDVGEGAEYSLTQLQVTERTGHPFTAGFFADQVNVGIGNLENNLVVAASSISADPDILVLAIKANGGTNTVNAAIKFLERY